MDYRKRADGSHIEPPPSPKAVPTKVSKKLVVSNEQLEAFNSLQALKLSKGKTKETKTKSLITGKNRELITDSAEPGMYSSVSQN